MSSNRPVVSEDEKYLRSIKWCANMLDEPGWVKTTWASRTPKGAEGGYEDAFFGETLNSSRTIRACLSFYKKPSNPKSELPIIPEVRTLLSIGIGVIGWPGVSHGGMIATILDESTGILISLNYDSAMHTGFSGDRGLPIMTAGLNVKFKKPLPVPGDYLVRVWFDRIEGRKKIVLGEIVDEKGTVFATTEATWMQLRNKI